MEYNRNDLLATERLLTRRYVPTKALASINVVNWHWAQLLLGWVTACGQVNHLGM